MKTQVIKNSRSGGTIIDFLFFLIVAAGIYGAIVYVPYIYKAQELQAIVKDYTFKIGSANPDTIRRAVIEDAKKKLDVELNDDDVIVTLDSDRVKIEATWRPAIKLVFGFQIPKTFTVEYDRKQL
jgi:hypothetical protein